MTHLLLVVFAVEVAAVVVVSITPTRPSLPLRRESSSVCSKCICYITQHKLTANCTSRNLTSVPDLPNSNLIDELLMDSNNLQELQEGCLLRYTRLTKLSLACNMIATINVEAFQNQQKLQYLNLTGNRLKYVNTVFQGNIFKYLNNLHVLSLDRNAHTNDRNQTYPDTALADLVSLEYLYLDGMTNQSFAKGFSNMTSLKELSFKNGFCNMQSLFNTTFVHLKQIMSLDLSNCNITYIEAGTFLPLKYSLISLDLFNNTNLGFDMVGVSAYGWQNSSLLVLNISRIVYKYAICIKITKDNLKYFTNTNITHVNIDENRIEAFQKGALPYLPKTLKIVSIKSQRFAAGLYLNDLNKVTGLKEIDLSGYRGTHSMPSTHLPSAITTLADCNEEDEPSCSLLVHSKHNEHITEPILNIPNTETCTADIISVPLPPNLTKIIFTYKQQSFCISALKILKNNLRYLDISYNLLSKWVGPIEGLDKLEYLDMSNNIATLVYPSFFQNFQNLGFLNISWNLLNDVIVKDSDGNLFRNLTSLKVFDLSGNTIQKLPPHLFDGLSNLRKLILSRNYLYSEKMHVKHMKNLVKIDLSYNMLRWISRTLMSDLDSIVNTHHHNVTIDLSFNPISCECTNLEFLTWMLKSKIKQYKNRRDYYCLDVNLKNISITQLDIVVTSLEHSCKNRFGLGLGIMTLILLFLVISLGGVIYRYRWKLRYWYYGGKSNFERCGILDNFQYDAYIAYAHEDEAFFTEMKENTTGNTIISRNDTDPRKQFLREVVDFIKKSRKTVLVLSTNFLRDGLCNEEMQMAVYQSTYTRRDVLLIIKLEDIPNEMIPYEISHLLQNDTYHKYQRENSQRFWQTFSEAIGKTNCTVNG